jgi:hypothetical protein
MLRLIAFVSGVAAGVMVTRGLHERPPTDFWVRPVGAGVPWRRADVPVGGATTLVVALIAPRPVKRLLRPLGWGAIVGCLAVALKDPYRA